MAFVVPAMIEIEVRIHCRCDLMVVHWILGLGQAEFDELL